VDSGEADSPAFSVESSDEDDAYTDATQHASQTSHYDMGEIELRRADEDEDDHLVSHYSIEEVGKNRTRADLRLEESFGSLGPFGHVEEGTPAKVSASSRIPANARWTKYSRDIVSSAALDGAQEEYEERSDNIIILRVLREESIGSFAVKTPEIRDERARSSRLRRSNRTEENIRAAASGRSESFQLIGAQSARCSR